MYKHYMYFEWKTHQDRRSAYLHFLGVLPSWSPWERQINHATSLSHMIQFGPLIFSPVKGKRNKQFLKRNTGSNEMFVFFLKWKQVTWSLKWSFTQSQLTKMLALAPGGSAENPFLSAESKRPPKLTKGRGLSAHWHWIVL